jgi:hypothetical protein
MILPRAARQMGSHSLKTPSCFAHLQETQDIVLRSDVALYIFISPTVLVEGNDWKQNEPGFLKSSHQALDRTS